MNAKTEPSVPAEQLARFSRDEAEFLTRLDEGMIKHWQGELRLPLLGHAWLYRWDSHVAAFGLLVGGAGGQAGSLPYAPSPKRRSTSKR